MASPPIPPTPHITTESIVLDIANPHSKSQTISTDVAAGAPPIASISIPDMSSSPSDNRFLRILYLHHAVTPLNFVAFLIAVFLSINFFVFINSTTAFVLSEILAIRDSTGDISGSIAFYDELLSIFMVIFWGILSDRFGRRIVYVLGFTIVGVALFLYPNAGHIYPHLLLARLLFAIGGAACSAMLTAVLGDCAGKLRGRISGLIGLCSGFGALLAVFLFLQLPATFEKTHNVNLGLGLRYTYYINGSLAIGSAMFLWFTLPRKIIGNPNRCPVASNARGPELSDRPITYNKKSYVELFRLGMLTLKDFRLLVAYLAGFAARGNTIIITIFLPLWVSKFYIENNLCQITGLDPRDDDAIKNSCRTAFTLASILSGVCQVFALIGAPIFGYLSDRLSPPQDSYSSSHNLLGTRLGKFRYTTLPVLISCIIAFSGYLLVFFIDDPRSKALYPIVAWIGVGEIGTVVCSVAIVSGGSTVGMCNNTMSDNVSDSIQQVVGSVDLECESESIRGTISGIYSFFGGIGILFCSRLGGYMFDIWTYTAPFFIMSVIHLIVAFAAGAVVVREWYERKRKVS